LGAVAAVAIEAAEPSGLFIGPVKQAERVISKESLQCLRRGIHCNDARARWLVGHFSIGRPFERRFFVFDGPDDLVAPHFVDCARCLGVAFIRRHPVVPSWLGIALQPAARGTAAWTSYLVSPLADG